MSNVDARAVIAALVLALETERGRSAVHAAALPLTKDESERARWSARMESARMRIDIAIRLLAHLDVDTETATPARTLASRHARSLVGAIERAAEDTPSAARFIASECILLADAPRRMPWAQWARLADERPADIVARLDRSLRDAARDESPEPPARLAPVRIGTRPAAMGSGSS